MTFVVWKLTWNCNSFTNFTQTYWHFRLLLHGSCESMVDKSTRQLPSTAIDLVNLDLDVISIEL